MAIVVTIAGIDKTAHIEHDSWNINQVLTHSQDSKDFTIISGARPTAGQEVIFTDGSTKLFRGIIDVVKEDHRPAGITRYDCSARDLSYKMNAKLVADVWENESASTIAAEIISRYCTGFTSNGVDAGAPEVEWFYQNYEQPMESLKKLAEMIGWECWVDYDMDVQFFDPVTRNTPAPMEVTDSTDVRAWKHDIDEQGLCNRVYVLGGAMQSDSFTHSVVADGVQTVFNLPHKPYSPTLTVAGVSKTLGLEGTDDETTHQYMYNFEEKFVRCSSGTAAPAQGATVSTSYTFDIPVVTMVEDLDSQAAVSAVQGGDGIYEYRITDTSLNTLTAAEATGQAYLDENSNSKVVGSFNTAVAGWSPGQILTVNSTSRSIVGEYVVQKVKIKPYGTGLLYSIEYGGRLKGLDTTIKALLSNQEAVRNKETDVINKVRSFRESATITDTLTSTSRNPPWHCGDADALCGFVTVDGGWSIVGPGFYI